VLWITGGKGVLGGRADQDLASRNVHLTPLPRKLESGRPPGVPGPSIIPKTYPGHHPMSFKNPEQFYAVNKATVEAALRLANGALARPSAWRR
jgi:hypothetical protein